MPGDGIPKPLISGREDAGLTIEFWAAVREDRNCEEWVHLETASLKLDDAEYLQMDFDEHFPDVAVNNPCVRIARFRAVEVGDDD